MCTLFTLGDCDIVLSGGDMSMIDKEDLKSHGLVSLVWHCTRHNNYGKVVKLLWLLPYLDPGVGWFSNFEISIYHTGLDLFYNSPTLLPYNPFCCILY